jgi:deoxyadenosine/deoxycytidine kinase
MAEQLLKFYRRQRNNAFLDADLAQVNERFIKVKKIFEGANVDKRCSIGSDWVLLETSFEKRRFTPKFS